MQHSRKIYFPRCYITQTFSRTVIELLNHSLQIFISELAEVVAFRKIFAKQTVSVLVGTSLPWLMRRREVELNAQCRYHFAVKLKFASAVGRYLMKRLFSQRFNHRHLNFFAAQARQLLTDKKTAFPTNQCHQALLAIKADNGINLPVTEPTTFISLAGTLFKLIANWNFPAICHFSSFPSWLATVSQFSYCAVITCGTFLFQRVEHCEHCRINRPINRLVAYLFRVILELEASGNLFRQPVTLKEQSFDQLEQFRIFKDFMWATFLASTSVTCLSFTRQILTGIASKFARNGGFVSAEQLGDLTKAQALHQMNQ